MNSSAHIVLGGNGVTGRATVEALLRRGETVTSIGRRPSCIEGVESVTADLLNRTEVSRILAGQTVAYFTVGLPYSAKLWAAQWPVILGNVIDAAIENGTYLIYLDNVYSYAEVEGIMTEQTPIRPSTKKGNVRADAIRSLEQARLRRGLNYMVGRSADFYGPGATSSMINGFVIDRAAAGKRCAWLLNAKVPHSLTFTPDIGEALAILGADMGEHGQTWHLPTAEPLTGQEYIELAAGVGVQARVMSLGTLRLGAIFNSSARETLELAYQFSKPYIFDSSNFEKTFNFAPTSTREGFQQTLAAALEISVKPDEQKQ